MTVRPLQKSSISFKIKACESRFIGINRMNILNISRIKIRTQRRDCAKGGVFQRFQRLFHCRLYHSFSRMKIHDSPHSPMPIFSFTFRQSRHTCVKRQILDRINKINQIFPSAEWRIVLLNSVRELRKEQKHPINPVNPV